MPFQSVHSGSAFPPVSIKRTRASFKIDGSVSHHTKEVFIEESYLLGSVSTAFSHLFGRGSLLLPLAGLCPPPHTTAVG
jgi:hypothetical protein